MGLSRDRATSSSKSSEESDLRRAVPSSARSSGWYATAENPVIMETESLTSCDETENAIVYVLPESRYIVVLSQESPAFCHSRLPAESCKVTSTE